MGGVVKYRTKQLQVHVSPAIVEPQECPLLMRFTFEEPIAGLIQELEHSLVSVVLTPISSRLNMVTPHSHCLGVGGKVMPVSD